MVTPQLVEYIKNTLGRGYAEDNVRDALVKKGWKQTDVDEAFRISRGAPTATPQTPAATGQQTVQASQISQTAQTPQTQAPQTAQTTQTQVAQAPQSSQAAAEQAPKILQTMQQPQTPQSSQASSLQAPQSAQTPLTPQRPMQAFQSPQSNQAAAGQAPQTQPQTPPAQRSYTLPIQQTPAAAPATPPRFQQPAGATPPYQVFPQKPVPQSSQAAAGQAPQKIQNPSASPERAFGVAAQAPKTGTASVASASSATPAKKSWKIAYIAGGIVVMLGAYTFFGVRYGLYAFGYNLFPFENLAQKIGLVKLLSSPVNTPAPSPRPSVTAQPSTAAGTPTPIPTPTPTPMPAQPQVNGRAVSLFGPESEAGSVAALAYSPDGQRVAFARIADGQNLWLLNLATNAKESLLKSGADGLPASVTPMVLSWSPDGAYVAVVGRNASGVTNLYAINIVSKTATVLTAATAQADSVSADPLLAPQWSNDSFWMLTFTGESLWRISRDGSQKSRITPSLPIGSFHWSKDNAFIAYTVKRGAEENVWTMQNDGKGYAQRTFGGVNSTPRFSPDSALIAYISRDASGDTLWAMSSDGANRRQLAVATGTIAEFSWSPDGKRVAFIERSGAGTQSLKMVQNDASGLEEILPAGQFEPIGFSAWNQNGSTLTTAGSKKFLISVSLRASEYGSLPAAASAVSPTP